MALKLARAASYFPTEDVFQALEKAKQLADETKDPHRQVRVLVALATWRYISGQPRMAVELALPAVAAARGAGLEELLVVPYLILGRAMFMTGDFRNCIKLIEDAQEISARFGVDASLIGFGLGSNLGILGSAYQQAGEVERGRSLGLEAVRSAEASGDPRQIGITNLFLGATDASICRFEHCIERLELALKIFEEVGDAAAIQTVQGWLGRVVGWRGDLDRGVALLERAIKSAEELNLVPWVPTTQSSRAELYILAGQPAEAVMMANRAVNLASETRQRSSEGEALRVRAWALHYAGGTPREQVLADFRKSIEVHRSIGARVLLAISLYNLAKFLSMTALPGELHPSPEEEEARALSTELGLDWLPAATPEPRLAPSER